LAAGGFNSVSCLSSSFCAAVRDSGQAVTYNGTSWSGVILSYGLGEVSCGSTTFCLASGGSLYGQDTLFNGTSWSSRDEITGMVASCVSATYCIAIDAGGNTWATYSNGSWLGPTNNNNQPQTIDTYGLENISCGSVSFCAADDTHGNALIYNGAGWTVPANLSSDPGIYPYWISCAPNTTFCVAVDANGSTGYSWTLSGGLWSPTTTVTSAPFDNVSCATANFCMGVTSWGTALIYNGTSWGTPVVVDDSNVRDLSAVSCPTPSFCAAVNAESKTFIYSAASVTSTTTTAPTSTTTVASPPRKSLTRTILTMSQRSLTRGHEQSERLTVAVSSKLVGPQPSGSVEFGPSTEKPIFIWSFVSGGKEIRTPDPLHAMQVLYQLSYTPEGITMLAGGPGPRKIRRL
jgi:hypothetical protein